MVTHCVVVDRLGLSVNGQDRLLPSIYRRIISTLTAKCPNGCDPCQFAAQTVAKCVTESFWLDNTWSLNVGSMTFTSVARSSSVLLYVHRDRNDY